MATKYVCFKIDDWLKEYERVAEEIGNVTFTNGDEEHPFKGIQKERIPDAVVIRRQDIFAAPALESYANSVLVAIDILKANKLNDQGPINALQEVADYFHEQAEASRERDDRKLPD